MNIADDSSPIPGLWMIIIYLVLTNLCWFWALHVAVCVCFTVGVLFFWNRHKSIVITGNIGIAIWLL